MALMLILSSQLCTFQLAAERIGTATDPTQVSRLSLEPHRFIYYQFALQWPMGIVVLALIYPSCLNGAPGMAVVQKAQVLP